MWAADCWLGSICPIRNWSDGMPTLIRRLVEMGLKAKK